MFKKDNDINMFYEGAQKSFITIHQNNNYSLSRNNHMCQKSYDLKNEAQDLLSNNHGIHKHHYSQDNHNLYYLKNHNHIHKGSEAFFRMNDKIHGSHTSATSGDCSTFDDRQWFFNNFRDQVPRKVHDIVAEASYHRIEEIRTLVQRKYNINCTNDKSEFSSYQYKNILKKKDKAKVFDEQDDDYYNISDDYKVITHKPITNNLIVAQNQNHNTLFDNKEEDYFNVSNSSSNGENTMRNQLKGVIVHQKTDIQRSITGHPSDSVTVFAATNTLPQKGVTSSEKEQESESDDASIAEELDTDATFVSEYGLCEEVGGFLYGTQESSINKVRVEESSKMFMPQNMDYRIAGEDCFADIQIDI